MTLSEVFEKTRVTNTIIRESLAEFLGTFTLVCLGCSANAAIVFSGSYNGPILGALAWGFSLSAAIFISGNVSGGHVNPAVSLGLATIGEFPWRKLLHYLPAQYLGAFFGSLITFLVYNQVISAVDRELTVRIFGTMPVNDKVNLGTLFGDQLICTMFFLLIICAVTDKKNNGNPGGLVVPLVIGIANLGLLAISFGYHCGTPVNPARDFAPRILAAMSGWGSLPFARGYWAISVLACHLGGILGCWIYKLMIGNHHVDL